MGAAGRRMAIAREGSGNDRFHLTPHHQTSEKRGKKKGQGAALDPPGAAPPDPHPVHASRASAAPSRAPEWSALRDRNPGNPAPRRKGD